MAVLNGVAGLGREPWLDSFAESLRDAADLNGQKEAWVERKRVDFPSPVELLCQIFDDSGVGDLLDAQRCVFSTTTDAALRKLAKQAARLDLDQEPKQLVASEAWIEFALEASRVLDLVRADLTFVMIDP